MERLSLKGLISRIRLEADKERPEYFTICASCNKHDIQKIAETGDYNLQKRICRTEYHLCDSCGLINTVETGRDYSAGADFGNCQYFIDYAAKPKLYIGQLTIDEIVTNAQKYNGEITPEDEEDIIIRR